MALLPKVKLKTIVSFPAAVFGGTGLAVRQENGKYFFDLDFSELAQTVAIPTAAEPTTFLALWESTLNTYARMSITDLKAEIGGGGGIPEAPVDGAVYGRSNSAWSKAVALSGDTMTGALILNANPTLPLGAVTKQYADGLIVGPGAVRYDIVQALTAAQQVQARQNIYAAPFDAMAYNGMQLNGSIDVSQERGSAVTGPGTYVCDMFWLQKSGTGNFGGQQSGTPITPGLPYHLSIQPSVAQASLAGTDFFYVSHVIEGYRMADLAWGTANAKPLTIGFVCKHTLAGTYSIVVAGAVNLQYPVTYTQNVADTAEYKTITIPGPTTGTWNSGNLAGLTLNFSMGAGPTTTAPSSGSWLTSAQAYYAAPGQVNMLASTANFFRMTGLIILPGSEAPSLLQLPFIMRPYGQELDACNRHLWVWRGASSCSSSMGLFYTASLCVTNWNFPTTMRAAPSFSVSSPADFLLLGAGGTTFVPTSMSVGGIGISSGRIDCNVSGGSSGSPALLQGQSAATAAFFNARL